MGANEEVMVEVKEHVESHRLVAEKLLLLIL